MHPCLRFLLVSQCVLSIASAAWFRGNTHTHTLNSDGDAMPDEVVKWYREHGYDFLVITDHETLTDVAPLNALLGHEGRFLVIRGEEVTCNYPGERPLTVHVNALNPRSLVVRQKGADARETLRINVEAVRAAGAIAQVNHPNFRWGLTAADIAAVKQAQLLEIANMHPLVNSLGAGPEFPSAEAIWDQTLTSGAVLWGVASDDTHHYRDSESAKSAGQNSRPGRGWIVVRVERLATDDLMDAIARGDFYASTGVALKDYAASAKEISIAIQPSRLDATYGTKFRVQFIGKGGVVLQDRVATEAVFQPKGDEGYVRARITDSNGRQAWTQPVFLDNRKAE
jgi:hypothetical protein